MRRLFFLLFLLPSLAWGYVSGVDDVNPNLSPDLQKQFDDLITTYYQHPSHEKVEKLLGWMNSTPLLQKKTAWPPVIGFLTVIFENNKEHLFHWMSLYDYNLYAQDVVVAALLHGQLKETALVFAQAHQWPQQNLYRLRAAYDSVDLKHLAINLPGHIDTLWGAYFASGDPVYVNQIVNVLFEAKFQVEDSTYQTVPKASFDETQRLAISTLAYYAEHDQGVHDILSKRAATEKYGNQRKYLSNMLDNLPNKIAARRIKAAAAAAIAFLFIVGMVIMRRKKTVKT